VLYRVAHAIAGLGLDLRTAKVATIGHEVVDAFAVRRVLPDGRRGKLGDPAMHRDVVQAILDALR
jgi:[protein-PII] uridylyltransferase